MDAVVAQPGPNLVTLLDHVEDVGGVAVERASDHVDIAGEGLMAPHLGPKRTAEGEVGMEDLGDKRLECGLISGHLPAMHRRLQAPKIQRSKWLYRVKSLIFWLVYDSRQGPLKWLGFTPPVA